jgi:subtilase family serine protease
LISVLAILTGVIAFRPSAAPPAMPTPHPTVSDYQFIAGGTTPPTNADCQAVLRTCFTPQAIQSAYNVGPLYLLGYNGRGMTIAIVDSWGSDTMAHDLHVFNNALDSRTCAARKA